MVPSTYAVHYEGHRQTAAKFAEGLRDTVWRWVTVGIGSPSMDQQVWARLPLSEAGATGVRPWLLIRRGGDDGDDHRFFLAYEPEPISEAELLRVCSVRWRIEGCYAKAKVEVGLDQH